MRISRPWLRRQNKTWYVCHEGVQVNLGKDKATAHAKYHKLMQQDSPAPNIKVRELLNHYWAWLRKNRSPETVVRRKPVLISFGESTSATLKAADLKAHHVQRWVDKWDNPTTKSDRIGLIKTVCNWGVEQGYLDTNPIARIKRPAANIRQEFIPPNLWQQVLDLATDTEFREFLFVMLATGCRVTEIRKVEAHHLDGNKYVFPIVDSKGRKRSRVIYLPDDVLVIVNRLAQEHPTGKLFRNRRGNPWDKNSIRCRFRRFKEKLGMPKLTATTLRHSFAHHRLTSGQDSLTVAKLMGHVDTTMLSRRYGHVEQNPQYMTAAANQINFPSAPSIRSSS